MGCDIHLHIEVKINEKWEHYACPSVNRFYRLFEKMAGVRGDIGDAISPPKGLPKDATTITMLDYNQMEYEAHSESWLGIDEIILLDEWSRSIDPKEMAYDLEYEILNCYLFGSSFASIKLYPEDNYIPGLTDVRFVFWFDC